MSVLVETDDENPDGENLESPALHEVEFCVIDLETTGGSNEYEAITEIGAVKYRAG